MTRIQRVRITSEGLRHPYFPCLSSRYAKICIGLFRHLPLSSVHTSSQMAEKKTQAGYEFFIEALKANKAASYGELREKAESKGFKVFPIMYGRAKAALGLVKSGAGKAKAAKVAKASKPKAVATKTGPAKRGRPMGGTDSKSGQIRELLKSGKTAAEIAKQVGCTVGLVYNVKSSMSKGAGQPAKRGPGRPRKVVAATTATAGLEGVIASLKDGERERERLMRALQQIRGILESL